jgi:pyruvate/oxaloacetate carboxyltransferase
MQKLDPRKMEDKFLEGLSQETLQMLIRKQKCIEQSEKTSNVIKKTVNAIKDEAMDVDHVCLHFLN